MFNGQCSMTLQSHGLLSLVGSSIDSLAGLFLGSVLHFLGLLGSSIGSVLSSTLDGFTCTLDSITGSTYG